MRKLLGLAAILFFIAPTVHAQNGFRFTSQVSQQGTVASVSNVVVLPANPIISFCNAPAIGVPCINKATTYTSATLATPCSTSTQIVLDGTTTCVANPDSQNNWGVWLASGQYAYTITLPGGANLGPFYVTAGGAGGGAGNPASPGQAFQLANAGVTGFATTGCGGQTIGIDSLTSPTVLNDPCSFAVGGPRPYMDVTSTVFAGGAKGDSSTDDTAAIQAAITAACATTTKFNGFAMHPAVVFPAGIYRVAQPQGSSAAIFTIPCTFLEFRGFPGGSASQFANPTSWIVVTAGASPGSGPVFLIQGPTAHNIRFADIAITGYNEAYWLRSTADITFDNAPMAITGQTGLTDNAALKITNTEEVWRVNRSNASAVHANGSEDPTTPTVLYTNETPLGAEAALNGYIHTSDVVDTGGGEQCIQRVNAGGELVQHFTFKNTFLEDSNTGFLTCTNTSGVPMSIAAMEFESVGVEPFTVTTAVLTLNDSQGQMGGIIMNDVAEGSLAIQVLAGHLYGYSVNGCNTLCSNQVVDANGNSIGTGQTYERYGAIDHFSDNSFLVAQPTAGLANQFSASPTISDRWCPSGKMFCSLGADPSFGFLFGSGDSNGFNVGLNQTAIETLDVQFASLLPPTAFSGTATTGGTLAAGTYFAQIWSASNLNCTNAPISAPTYSTGVVVGGSNNAINFAWTVPITTPSAPAGYCLEIQNSAISPGSEIFAYLFASGAGTTTFSYTGQAQNGTGIAPANAMVSRHRFTQNGLNLAGAVNAYTDTGAANAYVVTTAPTFSTLPLFFQVCFLTVNGNTGPSALNVDGIGATAIKKQGGTTALASGDIAPNSVACVQYDGTNFELQSSVANAPVAGVSSFSGDGTLLNNIASTGPVTATLATAGAHTVFGNRTGSTAAPGYGILVSADIPNNAANTSGTASLATAADHTPTLCGTGNAPTGVDASFNAVACASIASGLTVKTNTVNNTDQTVLDFTNPASFNGLTFAFSNPTGGKETFAVGGTLNNAGLTNAGTTVNGQSCVLGATCAIPFQHNGSSNTSQNGLNQLDSTADSVGLHLTVNNPSGIGTRLEVSGSSYAGNAATATALAATPSLCSTGQAPTGILANGNATGCSAGSGTVNPASQFSDAYYSAAGSATTISGVTAPTVNGLYSVFYNVIANAAVAPTLNLVGVPIDATNPPTLLYSDRASYLNWTSGTALALPAVTGNFAANMPFVIKNTSTTLTMTPNAGASDLIDGSASGTIIPNFAAFVYQDSTTAPGHWFTVKFPTFAAFGSSCGSSTQALNWSTTTGFGCQTITATATAGGSNTQIQYNNSGALGGISGWTTNGTTTQVGGATSVLDLSAMAPTSGLKVPTVAGAIPAADGFFGVNSTNHSYVGGSNGTTLGFAVANTGTGASTTCGTHTLVQLYFYQCGSYVHAACRFRLECCSSGERDRCNHPITE